MSTPGPPRLTKAQKALVADLRHVISTVGVDVDAIVAIPGIKERTENLKDALQMMVSNAIHMKYLLMDETLGRIIWGYFFPKKGNVKVSGVAPVWWRVNCFRHRHCTTSEGDREVAPPWSIVDSEGTVRSPLVWVRSKSMGERYASAE
jgi:hypothetical protein